LLITFQIVGAIFVRQLKNDNLKSFKQRVELSTYVENSLIVALSRTDTEGPNTKIKNILDDINNDNIQEVQVIDAKGTIRGDSYVNNRSLNVQKITNRSVKCVLYTCPTYTDTTYNRKDNKQYYMSITPLLNVSINNNAVVGAIYTRADMASVYDSVNNVVVIFASASLIAIVIGMV